MSQDGAKDESADGQEDKGHHGKDPGLDQVERGVRSLGILEEAHAREDKDEDGGQRTQDLDHLANVGNDNGQEQGEGKPHTDNDDSENLSKLIDWCAWKSDQ